MGRDKAGRTSNEKKLRLVCDYTNAIVASSKHDTAKNRKEEKRALKNLLVDYMGKKPSKEDMGRASADCWRGGN